MRRKLPKYEIWVGEEHKGHSIVEIFAEKIGEYKEGDDKRGIIYRVYRTKSGIIVHVYNWSNIGEGDRASAFEYDSLETAACEFRNVLEKMNLI